MRIAEAQLVRAIGELSQEKKIGEQTLLQSVKQFLMRKRLTKRIGKVVRALEAYEAETDHVVQVQATTAHALSHEAKKNIEVKAEELFGGKEKKTKVTFHEDKALIGGVRLETTNTRYDFSLSRTLLDLRKSFVK